MTESEKPSKLNKFKDAGKSATKHVSKGPQKLVKGAGGIAQKGVSMGSDGFSKGMQMGSDGFSKGVQLGTNGIQKGVGFGKGVFSSSKQSIEQPEVKEEKSVEAAKSQVVKKRRLNTALAAFDWESVGYYQDSATNKATDGSFILAKSEAMRTYLSDAYYSDFYVNTILVVGTCFFSWGLARLGGSILWLLVVFFCTASVYRAEFRRFVRDSKDDMLRLSISNRLEQESETLEWCNNLLSKVWIVYMPLMGKTVMDNANPILAGIAPGGGIDSIELSHFHLGSVAPKVTGIKSYTKISKSVYEMDWAFAFDPNNRENMTKAEIRKQIMPKVVIKAALGKGVISKKFPINVEDMGFIGKMKIRLSFTDRFPMIELIRVQFLEPPKIDYALKPIGGDTFGIDIMKFVPLLKKTVNDIVNYCVKSYLIAPNYQEVNLVDIMSAASTDINSVLAVNLNDISVPSAGEYYVIIAPENAAEDKMIKTDTKSGKSPAWNQVYYVLNNSIEQDLNFNVYKKAAGFGKDKHVGTAKFDMHELYQKDKFTNLSMKVEASGKKNGYVNFDLAYFPELEAPLLEDGTKDSAPESDVGILKFVLNEAKGLDVSSSMVGQLSPYAEIYINGKLKHKTRVLKRSNEPSFGDIVEMLISSRSETEVKVILKDSVGFAEDTLLGEYEGSLEDIMNQLSANNNPYFKLVPTGVIKLTPEWRPLGMTDIASEITHKDCLGALYVHLRDAVDLKNLEFTGKIDPYVSLTLNGKAVFKTVIHPETLNPIFEEYCYIPVTSDSQIIGIDVFDAEKNGNDRLVGSTSFKVSDYMTGTSADKVIKKALGLPKHSEKRGTISYSANFIPVVPVYSPKELEQLEIEDKKITEALEKEKEEQKRLEEEYKKHPDDYEYYDAPSPFAHRNTDKKNIPLEELVKYKSGILSFSVIKGTLSHSSSYFALLLDELAYPSLTIGPAASGLVPSYFGSVFIRDLKHSQAVFREARIDDVEEPSDVYGEKLFTTLEILEKAYEKPATFTFGRSRIELQVTFSPTKVELDKSNLIDDTGYITVDILNAEDLIAADSNGKSDPFLELRLNGATVFKTETIKKTLNPDFNESASFPIPSLSRTRLEIYGYDWDLAGDNDPLGSGLVDLSSVQAGKQTNIVVPLSLEGKSAGKVNLRIGFEAKYVRPQIQKFGGGLPGIGFVAKAPVKIVGGVAKGAVGGVGLLAGGVGKGGSKLLGAFSHSQKKSKRKSSLMINDGQSTINGDTSFGAVSSYSGTVNGSSGNAINSSVSSSTKFGGARSAGRVSIKELRSTNPSLEHIAVKVTLQNKDLGTKDVLKTRKSRAHDSIFSFHEEATYKALPEDLMIFTGVVTHRLGKDDVIGEASIVIGEQVGDVNLNLGFGDLVLNNRFEVK